MVSRRQEGNDIQMTISKVTDYIISYISDHQISGEQIAKDTGVPIEKLRTGYTEPLLAEEFLELCLYLKLKPEDITRQIK